ncbi:tetratricopeptide repeat protein [Aliikangiella sp. IMCC44359]|uniref:tetratricopeptide repeat protein n=1 Tax=Aliikangiella sp. IMCC44359 TaxID=3459125 RepID=UPI00403AA122
MSYFQRLFPRICLFLTACLLIPSCTTVKNIEKTVEKEEEPFPIVFYESFGEKPELIKDSELFLLTQEQQEHFFRYINNIANRDIPKHQRVSNYLKKIIKGFNYHSDTFIASDAVTNQRGNCLSLAILTTALARLAEVEVGYELMQTPPIYQKKGNTILTSQHVRSLLYKPNATADNGFYFLVRPVIKIDYFPSRGALVQRRVSESEFISMYYRNKAAEAIVEKNTKNAFWYSIESLQYSKNNAHAINMLALIYDREGYTEDAGKLYRFGIGNSDEKLELLSNYFNYLKRNKRFLEAEEIKAQIAEMNVQNPFDWLEVADQALMRGEILSALKYYDKVIELAPYLHHGFFGRAKAEFLRGNTARAQKAFDKAVELAHEKETKAMYEAKLSALTYYVSQN